jgi:hypothetical protein
MAMTAVGDAIYLPVPSSIRSPIEIFNRPRPYIRKNNPVAQHRVYRMPRQDWPRMTYGANGYATPPPATGKIIDILV